MSIAYKYYGRRKGDFSPEITASCNKEFVDAVTIYCLKNDVSVGELVITALYEILERTRLLNIPLDYDPDT